VAENQSFPKMKKAYFPLVIAFLTAMCISLNSSAQYENRFEESEDFANGVFKTVMDEKNIAGATFTVVSRDETIILKGYGYADVEQEIPVDPDTTLFRIGSISKLFVWVGVMQMVEQGKLDLDRDINEYLTAFQIPETYDQPVTLRSLMTHTPGFEDKLYQLFVHDEADMKPLEVLLSEQLPRRVRPPMQQASYSNHGTGLAQYLVELVSGMPFIEYAGQYIFEPLGMRNTTLKQPLPSHMAENMSAGYAYKNGKFIEKPFELVPLQGVGGVSTTASDMGRFMKALLNNSCHEGYCLLDSATFAQMITPVFYHADGVNPALLGFMDLSRNGRRIFGHGGNTFLFHSMMAIIPEENAGIFYSFNSEGVGGPSGKALELLTDEFIPDERPLLPTIEFEKEYLKDFAGSYRINRFPHTEIFKVVFLMSQANISVDEGQLGLSVMGETTWWLPVDSLTFRNEMNNEIIVFSKDKKGRIDNLYLGNLSIFALNKNRGIWNQQFHFIILALFGLVMFYILIIWLWMYFVRRKYSPDKNAPKAMPFISKLIAWITAACYLVFFVLLAMGSPPGNEIVFGMPRMLNTALFFPILAIPFTLLMVWQSITLIDNKNTRLRSRLFYWLSTLVFLTVIWQFYFWNLLGWNY
jgi:CubicO group peptidase (beta-lactamase class C family)